MTAAELMTQTEAENYMRMLDPTIYVEAATERIFGTYKGLPILLAGCENWKKAMDNFCNHTPCRTAFGYYLFD
jgi:hypothetical protein